MKRKILATIKNTGNVKHTFTIGATVGKPGGGTGCTLWYDPYKPHIDLYLVHAFLRPGQSAHAGWNFDDSGLAKGGNWAIVKVWKGPGERGCLDGDYAGFARSKIIVRGTCSTCGWS